MEDAPDKLFLDRAEAAEWIQRRGVPCTKKTLEKLASIGGGPHFVKFGRTPLYRPDDLDSWIAAKLKTARVHGGEA